MRRADLPPATSTWVWRSISADAVVWPIGCAMDVQASWRRGMPHTSLQSPVQLLVYLLYPLKSARIPLIFPLKSSQGALEGDQIGIESPILLHSNPYNSCTMLAIQWSQDLYADDLICRFCSQ